MTDNDPGRPTQHGWSRDRLLPHVFGLLSEDEEARLQSHLATCPECRTAVENLREAAVSKEPESREGHLPAHLMAQWSDRAPKLRGLERELTLEHLEACAECREVLTLMGHRPGIPEETTVQKSVVLRPRFRKNWTPWALGMAAAFGVAAYGWQIISQHDPNLVETRPGAGSTGTPIEKEQSPDVVPSVPETLQAPVPSGTDPGTIQPQPEENLLAELSLASEDPSPGELLLEVPELVRGNDIHASLPESTRMITLRLTPFVAERGSTFSVNLSTPDSLEVKALRTTLDAATEEILLRLESPSFLKNGVYRLEIHLEEPNGGSFDEDRYFELISPPR